MKVNLIQEKKRFFRYLYDLESYDTYNAQFKGCVSNNIYITLSPLEVLSLFKTYECGLFNSKCITIQDGVYDISNALYNKRNNSILNLPSVNNVLLCLGNHERDFLKKLNPECLILSYKPKYLNMLENNNIEKECIKYDFLITTANTPYFNDFEFNALVDLITKLINNLNESNYTYIFRIYDEKLLKRISMLNVVVINEVSSSFSDVASKVKCIFTTPSTISVESMFLDKPVASLYYRDEPLLTQTGWILHLGVNFNKVIHEMYEYNKSKMAIQNAFLKNYLDVDYRELTYESINNICEISSPSKVVESESMACLHSKWNFNIKYFIKKIISKYGF